MAFSWSEGKEVIGMNVKVVKSGEEFVGKVKFLDTRGLGVMVESHGLQIFPKDDVDIVEKLEGVVELKRSSLVDEVTTKNEVHRQQTFVDDVATRMDQVNLDFGASSFGSRKLQVDRANEVSQIVEEKTDELIKSEEEMKKIFNEVAPHNPSVPFYNDRGRNAHLDNLIHIDMSEVLLHKPPPDFDQVEMLTDTDSCNHQFYQLPVVVQSHKPRVDANGHILHGGRQEKMIRERLWVTPETPPHIETPGRLYIVSEVGELFEEAVDRILHSGVVGLSLEGEMLGRRGTLCWLNLCTARDVFMFDIVAMGEDAFKYGLKAILVNEELVKVVHDCRQINDCLTNQWAVEMVNVWDTMAGDLVFSTQNVFDGFVPQYARSLPHLLKDYMGIADSMIFFPRYRRTHLAFDSSVWKIRPLPNHLVLGAARNNLYLLALYKVVKDATLLPFHKAVYILNNHVKEKDDADADQLAFQAQLLPNRIRGVLPEWRQDREKLEDKGLYIDGHFIHQNVGNPDPVLIFSKDSMHMAKPHFQPLSSTLDVRDEPIPKPSPIPRLY